MKILILIKILVLISLCNAKGGWRGAVGGGRRGNSCTICQKSSEESSESIFSLFEKTYYGSVFGTKALPANSYLAAEKIKNGSEYLSKALFDGPYKRSGYKWGYKDINSNFRRRYWSDDNDRKWRATTKAPYFKNKVPGSEVNLPAAAVVGAATAFGLVTLLPLNVPIDQPLMHCVRDLSDITQAKIFLNGIIYECVNDTILMTNFECSKSMKDTSCDGKNEIMNCGTEDKIYCLIGTLFSRVNIFCNTTTQNDNFDILHCYEGEVSKRNAAFLPTKIQARDGDSSIAAKIHIFLLRLIGKKSEINKSDHSKVWLPEALTFSPETD